jgi:uncharacterized protein YuzE
MKSKNIKLEYDAEVDAAYLRLGRGKIVASEEVEPGLIVDYGADDRPLGVEVLRFSRRFARRAKPTRRVTRDSEASRLAG